VAEAFFMAFMAWGSFVCRAAFDLCDEREERSVLYILFERVTFSVVL
jgi:hypothetical protein